MPGVGGGAVGDGAAGAVDGDCVDATAGAELGWDSGAIEARATALRFAETSRERAP
jgi:hypothetical protein